MSAFEINRKSYQSYEEELEPGEQTMRVKLESVLSPGTKFFHEYDFGSTTELSLKVVGEHLAGSSANTIAVLARNNAPDIPCESCGKKATQVCAYCIGDGKGWRCEDCVKKNHKCGEEAMLPVVNSPRVGVCGYEG